MAIDKRSWGLNSRVLGATFFTMSWINPWIFLIVLLFGCATTRSPDVDAEISNDAPSSAPFIRVLGVAQDGGLPHAGCTCPRCFAARKDEERSSYVSSLGILIPDQQKGYMIDATPDIVDQLRLLEDVRARGSGYIDRKPVDGIFLTHAHMGHYTGLAQLGFEALSTKETPIWCSPRMADFLKGNAPWNQLVSKKNILLNATQPKVGVALPGDIVVTPFRVPHRAEYTDTYAFYIQGPTKRALYIPDTSPWHAWEMPVEAIFEGVDIAFIDGTFYSGKELPGRDITKIGHPLITDSMDLLQNRVTSGNLKVVFIHLNHSNPALDPSSPERKSLENRGFRVGKSGQDWQI